MAKSVQKPLTKKDLAEFTEETLLPAVERIVDERIDGVEKRIEGVKTELSQKINTVKLELMDYVGDKITDLRGDIILLMRKEDRRFFHLVKILHGKQVLDDEDIKIIEELKIFPSR